MLLFIMVLGIVYDKMGRGCCVPVCVLCWLKPLLMNSSND